jgi:hypothetical protein
MAVGRRQGGVNGDGEGREASTRHDGVGVGVDASTWW